MPSAWRCRPSEASDLVQTLASSLLCAPAGWIAVDLFGLQCYTYSQTTALVVVFLSAPFVTRRSRYRRTSMTTQDQVAPGSLKFLVTSLLISFVLVAPFIVLEWVNRRALQEELPFVLFTFMWLHALLIALLLTPAVRSLRSERSSQSPDTWSMGRPCTIRNPHSCVCECSHRSTTLLPRSAELRLRWSEALTRGSGSGVQVTCSNVDAARRLS